MVYHNIRGELPRITAATKTKKKGENMAVTKNEQKKLESIRDSTELLATNIIEFLRAERARALSEQTVTLDIKATKDITSTLRDLVGIIRDVNAMPDFDTRCKNSISAERLALAREQLHLRREIFEAEKNADNSANTVRVIMEPSVSAFCN